MTQISVGITTFKKRLSSLTSMVEHLKSLDNDLIINIGVNGEAFEDFSDEYRIGILNLCSKHSNVFPFFYQEFRSLAKIWNNLIISSKTEYNLILNDDLVFDKSKNLIQIVRQIITQNPTAGCFTINGSWSHYVITKTQLDEMNYFDERFLLHGEEDGDFVWRYIDKYNSYPPSVNIPIVANLHQTGVKDPTMVASSVEIGYADKPKFNQEFTVTKYKYDPTAKISGMYGRPHSRVLQDEKQYPYEKFFKNNKYNFKEFKEIILK